MEQEEISEFLNTTYVTEQICVISCFCKLVPNSINMRYVSLIMFAMTVTPKYLKEKRT